MNKFDYVKHWSYFQIQQTLKIGVPFSQYKGFGVYSELFVFWLENKEKDGVMRFPPDEPPVVVSRVVS